MSYETYVSNLRLLHEQLRATRNPVTASRIRWYIARLEGYMLAMGDFKTVHDDGDTYA